MMAGPLTTITVNDDDVAFREESLALLARYLNPNTPERLLALAAHLTGQLIALQNQRRTTPEMALAIVNENLVLGNRSVVAGLDATRGSA